MLQQLAACAPIVHLTLVQPDVFVVCAEEARTLQWSAIQHLLLAAEVLIPSTRRAYRFAKRRRYQEAGVPVYYIVDGDAKAVEIWTPGGELPAIERERLTWHPSGAPAPCTLSRDELFRLV